jgi:hypothetical protein
MPLPRPEPGLVVAACPLSASLAASGKGRIDAGALRSSVSHKEWA